MRWAPWAAAIVAALAGARALVLLADPAPAQSDLAAFLAASLAILFAFLALALAFRPRWWHWWFPAFWLGCGAAVLALAYKDSGAEEFRTIGPVRGATDVVLHVLLAPIELFFGFAIGFVEPRAPLYVLASLVFFLVGAELLRRRLWPRATGGPEPARSRG